MSARKAVIQLAAKTGMLIGALFVVTVLLAAIPEHREQGQATLALPGDMRPGLPETDAHTIVVHASPEAPQEAEQNSAPNASAADEKASERAAVQDMSAGDHDAHSSHMTMTAMREQAPGDEQRANEIVANCAAASRDIRTTTPRWRMVFTFFCRTCRSRNITSPAIATDFWRALRLMGRDQRRCCTRRLQLATSWWVRCTRCRSALPKTN